MVQWQGGTPLALLPPNVQVMTEAQTQVKARDAETHAALWMLELALNVADDLECKLGLMNCWTPKDGKYCDALLYIKNRKFFHAVKTLERLVVAHLFELAKTNLIGTGEQLHSGTFIVS